MNSRAALRITKNLLLLMGIVLLVLVIRKTGWDNFVDVLRQLSPFYVVLAVLAWILNLIIGTWRFMRFLEADVGFFDMFEIYTYSFLCNYAGGIQGVGVGARVGMLKMKNVRISRSSASIGSEIIYDIIVSASILLIGLVVFGGGLAGDIRRTMNSGFFVLPVIVLLTITILFLIFRKKVFIGRFLLEMRRSLFTTGFPGNIFITIALYIASAGMVYFLYRGIGSDAGLLLLLFANRSGYILGLISLIPGGLGVKDIVFGYVCTLSGIPFGIALSISIVSRVISITIVLILLAIISCLRRGNERQGERR